MRTARLNSASLHPPGTQYGFNVAEDQAWIIVHEPGDTAAAVVSARVLIEQERH
jgi:hypothetical protein